MTDIHSLLHYHRSKFCVRIQLNFQKSGNQSGLQATRRKIRQQRAAVSFTSTPMATACATATASFMLSGTLSPVLQ